VSDIAIPDHFLISFYIPSKRPAKAQLSVPKTYLFRGFKAVDHAEFIQQLESRLDTSSYSNNPRITIEAFSSAINQTLDALAPSELRKTRLKERRYNMPWSNKISQAKQLKRKLERQYLKTKLTVHKQMIQSQISHIRIMARRERGAYLASKLSSYDNSKQIFSFYNSCTKQGTNIPSYMYSNEPQIARDFGEFR
jgi:hypothetical protein